MRVFIIWLSIIFFILSAIITAKALELPLVKTSYQENPEALTPDSNNILKKLAEDQEANKAIVANLQATISQLEEELKTKGQAQEEIKTTDAEIKPRTLAVFSGWTFRPGKTGVNEVALTTVNNFVGDILAAKGSRVLIEGHTDNIPTGKQRIDNIELSLRRAKAIANVLVSRGVSPNRISVVGYGDAQPIESNDTEEGRARNRRVEVKLLPNEGQN